MNEEPKKNNLGIIIIIILILIIMCLVGYIVYDKVLTHNNDTNNNTNTTTPTNNEPSKNETNNNTPEPPKNVEQEISLSEDYTEWLIHILSITTSKNISYNKEYMDDYNFRFAYVLYNATRDLKYSEDNINGEEETGAVNFSSSEFKEYYLKLTNSNFDINLLNKNSYVYGYKGSSICVFPEEKNGRIYSDTTGTSSLDYVFDFVNATYNESTKLYTVNFKYQTRGDLDETTNDFTRNYLGKATFKYTLDSNNNKVIKSFIVTK